MSWLCPVPCYYHIIYLWLTCLTGPSAPFAWCHCWRDRIQSCKSQQFSSRSLQGMYVPPIQCSPSQLLLPFLWQGTKQYRCILQGVTERMLEWELRAGVIPKWTTNQQWCLMLGRANSFSGPHLSQGQVNQEWSSHLRFLPNWKFSESSACHKNLDSFLHHKFSNKIKQKPCCYLKNNI